MSAKLVKAELRELDQDHGEINKSRATTLQFNPESLKLSFANQIQAPTGPGDKSGTAAIQFVGAGTTKLALAVFFDASSPPAEGEEAVDDVRKLTSKVAYYITPKAQGKTFLPPLVRFVWGSFQFDGIMDAVEESLDFFSSAGKPLRAMMSLSMSQQRITEFSFAKTGRDGGDPGLAGLGAPGTTPLAQAAAGATVQGLAAAAGAGADWQAIASANGIENPRQLAAGRLLDLNVSASASVSVTLF